MFDKFKRCHTIVCHDNFRELNNRVDRAYWLSLSIARVVKHIPLIIDNSKKDKPMTMELLRDSLISDNKIGYKIGELGIYENILKYNDFEDLEDHFKEATSRIYNGIANLFSYNIENKTIWGYKLKKNTEAFVHEEDKILKLFSDNKIKRAPTDYRRVIKRMANHPEISLEERAKIENYTRILNDAFLELVTEGNVLAKQIKRCI